MPRKASARKSTSKNAGKTRSAETPEQRRERKAANPAHREASEETARVNASAQTVGPEVREARGKTPKDTSKVQSPTRQNANGEADAKDPVAEARKVQTTQGPSGHPLGSAKAPKPDYKKAEAKVQGQTKVLREKGSAPKAYEGPVVQQGGGGAVKASGDPIR